VQLVSISKMLFDSDRGPLLGTNPGWYLIILEINVFPLTRMASVFVAFFGYTMFPQGTKFAHLEKKSHLTLIEGIWWLSLLDSLDFVWFKNVVKYVSSI